MINMKKNYCLILILLLSLGLKAQVVIRGPYLQSPTHSTIKIMWRTDAPSSTKVWYGTSPGSLTNTVVINNNVTDHVVMVSGLQPNTRYYYAVGNTAMILAGQTSNHTFKTHPVPGTTEPTRIWAIGDFGKGNAGQVDVKNSYLNYPESQNTDVWIWLGDNAYDDGKDSEYQNKVFNVTGFSDIFSWLPFYPSPGNHDYGEVWSESTLLGIPYTNIPLQDHQGPYFDIVEVPQYGEAGGHASNLEVFYSFDYGDVHFLSLNSEVFDYTFTYDGINEMKNWIQQDLQNNTRKFTIAYFHQPPYSKGSHDSDDLYELVMKAMREKIIPTLESYDIDLVVCGHSHVFERSFLINGHYGNSSSFNPATMLIDGSNGNLQQGNPYIKDDSYSTVEGTVYVVCGNSGSNESSPDLNHPVMAYSDGGSGVYGSFIIDVNKNRLDGKYLKTNGTIADEFTILKKDLYAQTISNQVICEGDSILIGALYTGGSDQISYQWNPSMYTDSAVYLKPVSTTIYTVTVTDQLTNQFVSTTFQISVLPMPLPLVTEVISGTLGSSVGGAGYTYQWFINGNPITGATNQYYSPLFNGNYSVTVTGPNGCSRTSVPYTFTMSGNVGIEESEMDKINIYPNPTSDILNIVIDDASALNIYQYNIMDMRGRAISQGVINGTNTIISLEGYESSMYILLLINGEDTYKLSFSKK